MGLDDDFWHPPDDAEQIEILIDFLLMEYLGDPDDLALQFWGGISWGDSVDSPLVFRSSGNATLAATFTTDGVVDSEYVPAQNPDADQRILRGWGMDKDPAADLRPQSALSEKYGKAVSGIGVLNTILEREGLSQAPLKSDGILV